MPKVSIDILGLKPDSRVLTFNREGPDAVRVPRNQGGAQGRAVRPGGASMGTHGSGGRGPTCSRTSRTARSPRIGAHVCSHARTRLRLRSPAVPYFVDREYISVLCYIFRSDELERTLLRPLQRPCDFCRDPSSSRLGSQTKYISVYIHISYTRMTGTHLRRL